MTRSNPAISQFTEEGSEAVHELEQLESDTEEWKAVAGGSQSVGLIFKTVADPFFLVC